MTDHLADTQNFLETYVEEPRHAHWLGRTNTQNLSYCRRCAEYLVAQHHAQYRATLIEEQKANSGAVDDEETDIDLSTIEDENGPFVDGGCRPHESDYIPFCESCDRPLSYILSNSAFGDELYALPKLDIQANAPGILYEIERVLSKALTSRYQEDRDDAVALGDKAVAWIVASGHI